MIRNILKDILRVALFFALALCTLKVCNVDFTIDWLALSGSIISAAFVITIRDPYNYKAFVTGALSSLILGISMWEGQQREAITYLTIFLASQIYSFFVWRKKALNPQKNSNADSSLPRWQTKKELIQTLAALVVIVSVCSTILITIGFTNYLIILIESLFFASAIIANILLIYKLTESRVYWVIFSAVGLASSISRGEVNIYMLLLFLIFLTINIIVLIEWIKITPPRIDK